MSIAKIILGAKITDLNSIREITTVYAQAGADIIDVCANCDVITVVKNVLADLNLTEKVKICASITLGNDIHSRKATIIQDSCNNCLKCLSVCPQKAIIINNKTVIINKSLCSGCTLCANICSNKAINLSFNTSSFEEQFIAAKNADLIEIHTNGKDENLFEIFNYLKENFSGEIGICISKNSNTEEKINIIKKIQQIIYPQKLIVQADGNSISGINNNIETTQKAIEECKNFQCLKDIILIASGGTNFHTKKLINQSNINVDGIAWGTFARKIISEENRDKIKIAKQLIFNCVE